jgi:serine/threonine protein kinase
MPALNAAAIPLNTIFHERYRIVRSISAGGMGAVYEVLDERTRTARALKVMLPSLVMDPKMRERFSLEAQVTGTIESDHIVRVSDAGIDQTTDVPFIVMELLRGKDVQGLVKARGPLPKEEVILYMSQVARALDKTHAAGIIHRDLKPENLFVTQRDDGTPCVKILDFGIAKVVQTDEPAQTTQTVGTPLYMSPEQIRGLGLPSPATDIWALTFITYVMLTGEIYWAQEKEQVAATFELLMHVVMGPREAPSIRAKRRRGITLPPAFDAWFARGAALQPQDRFDRASTAVAALEQALMATSSVGASGSFAMGSGPTRPPRTTIAPSIETAATPPGVAEWTSPPQSLRPKVTGTSGRTIAVTAALVMLVGGAGIFLTMSSKAPPTTTTSESAATLPPVDAQMLKEAGELAANKDFDRAHSILMALHDDSPARDTSEFKDVESKWANWSFSKAEVLADLVGKRRILMQIAATPSIGLEQRKRALDMLQTLAEPASSTAPPAGEASPTAPSTREKHLVEAAPTSSNGEPPPPGQVDEVQIRRGIEGKVWSGKANEQEIKLLIAICKHQRDIPCRDRAVAMLQKKRENP